MRSARQEAPDAMWSRHHAEWRDAAQIASQWKDAADTDPRLLRYAVRGAWWDTLAAQKVTLLITREYEHLVIAMSVTDAGPVVSYMPMPHPSGLVVDDARGMVHIASTRNPNQVYDLMPVTDLTARLDVKVEPLNNNPLVPVQSRFFPGCLYMHDLAIIGGDLYATAVGHNSVVRLGEHGRYRHVWWPRCVESDGLPVLGQNHIQLNSIAAGADLTTSYFSASADRLSFRRPGHRNFPVDKRGVLFSGATREPVATGLTRPHSARLHNGLVWLDNSGYGEFGCVEHGGFVPVARLPGWTRGLCVRDRIAFVGTSRVIPRFRRYAPGLEVDASLCGVHAVDMKSGRILGSLIWPYGNQIFAVEAVPSRFTSGFPFMVGAPRAFARQKKLFYTFHVMQEGGE
jgi:uncharacterized protein (TIGR03032 family)